MSKKTTNILITALLLIVVGGFLLFQSLPYILAMAANTVYAIVLLIGVPLVVYGVYRLVKYFNR